ncbi:63 kDa sperm flagellar membrane protein [Temnothorax longispinosus]|uniref:63 kDa sperm flagellar membrane protein n=1 Tax=Temnothorax longispinosus TaxID=300112 RepID=A0A4S2JB52_9HYME|nr:63 kDa sperm flagellar membrane protein [Temnothorax longispinosus]
MQRVQPRAHASAQALTCTREENDVEKRSRSDNCTSRPPDDIFGVIGVWRVTTVLLVPARPGKSVPPVGILTKTARTFVQDGASTEFATQVLGTTLDNGRLYARILSTSSRVFYDRESAPDPSSPYIVYPSRAPENDWRLRVALDNAPIRAIEEIEVLSGDIDAEKKKEFGNTSKLDELSKENDIFNKRELNVDTQRFKPAKVRPADNLPTYTVKHEYVSNNFDSLDDAQSKTFRPRVPKIFKPQVKTPPPRKLDIKPLATVTYHGFADFTTTVGDTVIVFSPSTSPAPMGRPATTIKGDATLRPDDGVAVSKIRPTTVMEHARTDRPYEGDRKHGSDDQFLSAINRGNIQPSVTEEIDAESSKRSTEPLLLVPDVETGSLKPTGLLKVVDSTTSSDGTTTHYKSHIYGTYIGTNYAQIIHTSSNVYFFPDDATATYGDDTTVDYGTTETESDDQDTTVELPSTTPTTITTSEDEMNELTTPLRGTTDSVLTTLKDILESARRVLGTTESVLPTLDDEIPNDIVPGDPQGHAEEKATLTTRLLPSTVYKTFTYFTTFFIPGDSDQTTTSIRSREVVSSEVTFLTELIRPTSTKNLIRPTTSLPSGTRHRTPSLPDEIEEEQTTKQDEEIELIFKTLYTTYTYLTTFFQENTSSVSSRQVVETNVITQTVGPNGVSAVVASLFGKDESTLISPTTISQNILPSVITNARTPEEFNKGTEPDETTEGGLTTFQQQDTTVNENVPTESITTVDDYETSDGWTTDLEPSPTPAMASAAVKEQVKTYYTTYTYFTTIFVDDETEIETRTEVFTNVVTETITPTKVQSAPQKTARPTSPRSEPAENKPAPPPEILAYLEALQRQKSQEEALLLAKKVQQANTDQVTRPDETTESNTETTTEVPTTLEDRPTTERLFRNFQVGAQVTPNPPTDVEVLGSMITDVVSSSSSGGGTVLDVDKRNIVPEDQELSESNNHEVEPAPTLLLQTSYTTFTYFTTMYKGDQTNVVSRLETVTNVVTETLRPSLVVPVPTSTQPVTYFTTFTYWTTFYKGGDTITTSREETVSNVVTPGVSPTPTVELGVIMTYTPTVNSPSEDESANEEESKITADNEVTPLGSGVPEKSITNEPIATKPDNQSAVNASSISPEPTTFYTTFTYFTTSYVGNETILNSRLETVTSVSIPDIATQQATGRAIGGPVYPSIQTINTDEKTVKPSKVTDSLKTGLISTIRSSEVHQDTTTHYMTDVYGTYIDGYYARVVKSSTRLETPPLSSSSIATPVLPTGDSGQDEEDDEEGEEDDDGQSSKKKSRLTFSTRKRTFTPVIRPFASRNRPTFNPKRKGAQAATTITRTDITPTITATLAGKGNRFASSRGRVTSPIGPYSSTLSPSGSSRRFSGRRGTATTTSSSAFPAGSTRGRVQPRITPSSVFQSNRRGPTSVRGSSSRVATRASSSAFPSASSRYRSGIRPSSTLLRGQPTAKHDDQENDANEFTTTTLVTDETPFTEDFDGETVTTPLQTTTESSRRSTNPLLRFRRPINLNSNSRTVTTSRPPTTTTPRRSGNLNRPSAPTVPRVTNGRTNTRATPPVSTRTRPSNTGLFPPRGFLGRKQEVATEEPIEANEGQTEGNEGFEDEPVEEISDNDYEGSEHEDRRSNANVNRRSGKAAGPVVQIRPFGARTRRVRRQASQLRAYSSRFRRPAQSSSAKAEERSDSLDVAANKEDTIKVAKPIARYNNRARSLTSPQPQKTSNSPDQTAETSELSNQQSKPRTRSKQPNGNRNGSVRIKPSPASNNGRQFTLREKDSSSNRSTYKRPTTGPRTNGRSTSKPENGRVRPPRLRNESSKSTGSTNSRRVSSSRSRSTNGRNGNNRRVSTRGRGSYEDIREAPTVYPNYDGTITVTHYVPTEVTIPVVNNGVTEHRNIVTAQPSTEVLGPSQYSTVTVGDGKPLVVIVSEVTGTNVQGQAEVTRFLLHETPTTRISHTLTSLGGRRVSQSVIIPTTVYSVENIVSTVQPSLPGNAPLANILLSQLLLGQLGQPNPLLQTQATPTTQYNTRTTSYVTTITKHQSTIIPLTFRGKEILTTLVDSSTDVVTATEFITDTVVVTPTVAIPAANINSLLLLLQQPQTQPQNPNPLLDPLFAAAPFTQSNTLPGEVERRHQPADSDYRHDSYEYDEEDDVEDYQKSSRPRGRGKSNDKKKETKASAAKSKAESSVVTLYVSGRRPGEFSTVLSTVKIDDSATASRRRRDASEGAVEVRPSVPPSLHAGPVAVAILAGSEDIDSHAPTQSLESVVGDVGRHISTLTAFPKSFSSGERRSSFFGHVVVGKKTSNVDENQSCCVCNIDNPERLPGSLSLKLYKGRVVDSFNETRTIREDGRLVSSSHIFLFTNTASICRRTRAHTTKSDMILFRLANNITNRQPPGNLYGESVQYGSRNIELNREGTVDTWSTSEDYINNGRINDDDESLGEAPRKRVRIRVPVVRSRTARQHKFTVVRRRPLTPLTPRVTSTTHAPRRIVVTRVRTLGSGSSIYPTDAPAEYGSSQPTGFGRHKVTITRRRKLQFTPTSSKNKVRVTRKKLIAVRPIQPTSTFAVITTGFFTAPSSEYDEYSDEEEYEVVKEKDHSVVTPGLEETPNLIDNKPDEEASLVSLDASSAVSKQGTSDTPVIITDNFFFPPSDNEENEEYEDDTSTTTENANKITVLMKDEHPTISPEDEDNIVSNKSDVESDNITVTTPISQTTSAKPSEEQTIKTLQESDNASIREYEAKDEEEGRRFNLATRVMSNGVEVIVAGPTPALRWENSNPQPTLTLSEAVVMLLPQDKPNEFVTKTCTTTFTYLNTITKDGTTTVSTEQQVVANTATEERHRKPGSETAAVTLDMSPTLRTEVFKTTYTYLTLNTDHPDVNDALESSTKVITNTVTAPQHYLDMILEPSEAPRPETNTYLSTRVLEKTFMKEGRTKTETVSDTITQLIVTESAPPPRPTSVTTTLTALDNTDGSVTDMTKTYYITYTYFNTFLEKGSTVVRTNVATSTDVVLEKVPVRKTTMKTTPVNPTPEPIQIFATKTYLTTFTYFTTLLQAGPDGETSTTVTSRSHIVENVVTESIAPSLLDAGYMNALLTTAHHSDPVKNVVTGSTIIFFDEEDQIDATATTNLPQSTSTAEIKKHEKGPTNTTSVDKSTETASEDANSDIKPEDSIDKKDNNGTTLSSDGPQNKRPSSQSGDDGSVSKPLLSLGSLGINSLSALGPVITAMAGLLQGKTAATRRNDSVPVAEIQEVTTQRSPIYIPVAEFADGDIETAESQHIAAHLANLNHNYIAETRHKVTSSLADGIPISPGEVITANSDVIIGKPGKMAPRPPQTYLKDEGHIGMKPPPIPVPNIPVHPVLEVLENDDDVQAQQTAQDAQVQILPAHQVYEEHLKIPVSIPLDANHPTAPKQPQKLLPIQSSPPKRITSKQDILENDPLLKPPNRPNVEQYANPNVNHKIPEWNPDKYRRPWSAKDPLTPPARLDEIYPDKPNEKPHPTSVIPSGEQKRPPWAQKDPLLPESSIIIQDSEPKPIPTEPIVHQVPHVIDRSTGQPLLVNIQPSQVANVVIPQGGTQALIFGDTNEPHISGQYFDDPSPYPEPEVGPGFVGIQKGEDFPQYSNEKNPAHYMIPPSPSTNFKSSSPKPGFSNRPHAVLLSPIRGRPQEVPETPVLRPDKRPSEIHLIKRPDGSGNSVRGHFSNGQTSNQAPPRRVEVAPTEIPHRYIFLGKPDGNEITLGTNWKSDKKPIRFALNNRPRPRPRPTTNRPLDRHVFVERPTGYPPIRKPTYSGPQRPPVKTHNTFALPHRPPMSPQSQEPTRITSNLFNLQIDNQNRPPHIYQDKNVGNVASPTEQNDHVPTGAIEYHNPLHPNPISEENKHSQVSATKTQPGDNHEKWQTNTEQLDSDIGASEYVNYQNHYHGKGNRSQETDGQDKKGMIDSQSVNQTLKSQTLYGPVVSINTVVGKPLEVGQEHDVTYDRETNGKPLLQGPHGSYNTRPYELPIIQGKPFGVYNGYVDPATPYGYKQQEVNKPDYEIVHGIPAPYNEDPKLTTTKKTQGGQPPAIIPQFGVEVDRPGRPYSRPIRPDQRPGLTRIKPEILTKPPIKLEVRPDYSVKRPETVKPNTAEIFVNQTLNHGIKLNNDLHNWNVDVAVPDIVKSQQKISTGHDFRIFETKTAENKNRTTSRPTAVGNKRPSVVRPEHGTFTRVHPEYPHILTKPKPQVPEPVIVSSGTAGLETHGRPNKFSMSVEATGEEVDSKTQTERPPSMLVTKNNPPHNKKNDETLDTAYQTNFASSDSQGEQDKIKETNVPSRTMMPPPLNVGSNQSKKKDQEGLKPPPPPSSDVLGLSPPPVDITTTHVPVEDRFALMTTDESGLKPPKYVPLKESTAVARPSTNMVPPNPRPSLTRPFLVELLSQDMVPPPPILTTTRPLEIATVRPAVAVSGSIQIATAVATSHIPVIQDIESKIPIIHGTVDLPVVVDVPEILRSVETRRTEHVSIYTVRPFDTRPVSRIPIQSTSTLSTNIVIPTKLRPPQVDHIHPSRSSTIHRDVDPTRTYVLDIPPNPVKRPEHPVFLESSHESVLPSTRVEPTESLTFIVGTDKNQHSTISNVKTQRPQVTEYSIVNKTANKESSVVVTRVDSSITKVTSTLIPTPGNKTRSEASNSTTQFTKNIIKTPSTVVRDQSNATIRTKPKEVTRFKTSTVTRTKTSVLGSPPTTRTLLLTHTMTTTTVETVTETLLRPTSVVSTITSTILQPIVTRVPSTYDNVADNDSIFVVMSDQNPPAPGAEEVEAEYGEEVSRDEQDPTGNEIHRVLSGGVLGAPIVPLTPVASQCTPECKSTKSEICAEVGTEMRCVCRPGFARMFPDRPCKPTYTYTLRVGLDRIGHEFVAYDTALNDSTSATYKRLVVPTKDALDRTLMQSDLRDVYRGLKIAGFIPDPTKVEFHVQLSDNANETRLKEVLRKYLVGSNYSLGGTEVYASKNLDSIEAADFDECASKEGGPHHDCSPHAACFNLRGSYQCSCREGWADLSENPAYPGRVCSQAPLGCAGCNNKGHCVTNSLGQDVCECFPWHSGQRCQVNLKVLLIALVTTGAILLGLLAICVGMTCFRHPGRDRKTGDRRAMIPGTGGDTSSEGSVTDLAIPHHVPHVLPPPPQMLAPLPPNKRPVRKISAKPRHPPRKATMIPAAMPINDEQRDRSLTVMIPRAKYRSAPQSPQNYNKTIMSTFAAEEHKLISYLDNGTSHCPANRKQSISSTKDCKEADFQGARNPMTPTGALVSAGFQVSATVTRTMDAESTLARSCGETTVEPATKVLRSGDLQVDLDSTLARSCGETTIQAPTKLLRLDLGEAGSTLARSCGETTIQPPTKVAAARRNSVKDNRDNRDTRDSASEGHTMAERDLGSTLRLPAQHPPLYSPDRVR